MEGMETTSSKLCPYVAHSGTGTMHSERCKEKRRTKIGERRPQAGGREESSMYGKEDVIRGLIGTVSLNSDALLFLTVMYKLARLVRVDSFQNSSYPSFGFSARCGGPGARTLLNERIGGFLPSFPPSFIFSLLRSLPPAALPPIQEQQWARMAHRKGRARGREGKRACLRR